MHMMLYVIPMIFRNDSYVVICDTNDFIRDADELMCDAYGFINGSYDFIRGA